MEIYKDLERALWGKYFLPLIDTAEIQALLFHSGGEVLGLALFGLWVQLWTLAMRQHNPQGELLYGAAGKNYAMTENDIARALGIELSLLMDALPRFLELNLITKNGTIYLVPLAPITFNYSALQEKREKDRIYQAQKREKTKKTLQISRNKSKK